MSRNELACLFSEQIGGVLHRFDRRRTVEDSSYVGRRSRRSNRERRRESQKKRWKPRRSG